MGWIAVVDIESISIPVLYSATEEDDHTIGLDITILVIRLSECTLRNIQHSYQSES